MDNPEINKHGDQIWRNEHGEVHRDGEPAEIWPDSTKIWRQYGEYHSEYGPAVIYPDGHVSWVLDGNYYTFEDWLKKVDRSDEEKVMLKLKYG